MMKEMMERICRGCHGCQVMGQYSPPEPMQRTEPPTGSWQDVTADLMGPMPSGENLLVVVDYYSRFFEVVVMKSTSTPRIIATLMDIFARFGFPYTLKTDNWAQFVSGEFEGFRQECGIEHRKSPPLWPQVNGEVERQNRTLLKFMKIAAAEGKRWLDELPTFLLAYRSTPQVSTGATPTSPMFGKEISTKLPELRPEKYLRDESMRDKDWEQKLKQKEYADGNRGTVPSRIVPGHHVLLKNTRETENLAPKFETKPYTVLAKERHKVTVESSEGAVYKRDSSAVESCLSVSEPEPATESVPGNTKSEDKPGVVERPGRIIRSPERFKDYVLGKPLATV